MFLNDGVLCRHLIDLNHRKYLAKGSGKDAPVENECFSLSKNDFLYVGFYSPLHIFDYLQQSLSDSINQYHLTDEHCPVYPDLFRKCHLGYDRSLYEALLSNLQNRMTFDCPQIDLVGFLSKKNKRYLLVKVENTKEDKIMK